MSPIYGSSRIQNVSGIYGETGPTGPTGAIGPKGITGDIGHTGSIGLAGIGIISGPTGASGGDGIRFFEENEHGGDIITFSLTDGTTLGVSGARGATGDTLENDYSIINTIESDGYGQVFKVKSGATAFFRNLTISGRDITVEEKDYTILLKGRTYDYGVMGNTGELVYQYDGLSAHGALNTYWDNDNNNLLARILTHREIWDSNNFSLSWDNNVQGTPTNLDTVLDTQNIEGKNVPFSNLTLVDIQNPEDTTIIGNAYQLSSKIHMGQTGNSDGSSADVIHNFPNITFTSKISSSIIGSCCYCENKGEGPPDGPNCIDYVTRIYCDNIGGIFSDTSTCLNRPEGPDCYVEGSCCVFSQDGSTCIQASEDNCKKFGGFFISNLTCDELDFMGGCPDPCPVEGACCINNVCFDMGEYECSFYPNSVWFNESCDNVNCCLEGQYGACCLDEVCYNTTASECSSYVSTPVNGVQSSGIFWGVGSKCAGPYEDSRYYAHDCTNDAGEVRGVLENGACPDGSSPPCTDCIGWTQIVSDECVDSDGIENICKCLEDAGGSTQCDCDCNACGSNSEDSCGSIKLVDGTCWECCCGSIDLPEADLPEAPTTTQAPPYEDCYTYDDGSVTGNCLWRCYVGLIPGCADTGVPCAGGRLILTYQEYKCFQSLLSVLDVNTGISEAIEILMSDEPFATQCSDAGGTSIFGNPKYDNYVLDEAEFDEGGDWTNGYGPIMRLDDGTYAWIFTPVPGGYPAPDCAVTSGGDTNLFHPQCISDGATYDLYPCEPLEEDLLWCESTGAYLDPCFSGDCCPTDVTTNPPFPEPPPVLPLSGN